jgi:hypothetical protein
LLWITWGRDAWEDRGVVVYIYVIAIRCRYSIESRLEWIGWKAGRRLGILFLIRKAGVLLRWVGGRWVFRLYQGWCFVRGNLGNSVCSRPASY